MKRQLSPHHAGHIVFLACLGFAVVLFPGGAWGNAGDRYVSAYVAQHSPDRMIDILNTLNPSWQSSYLGAVTWGYVFARTGWFRWEVEGQLVRHTGMQHHWETNAVAAVRLMSMPWDRWLDTRLSVGNGLSWASEEPRLEPRGEPDEGDSAQLLNYTKVELEVTMPDSKRWSTFLRLHHRSGIMGTFSDVKGGSNFIGLGLRRRMD